MPPLQRACTGAFRTVQGRHAGRGIRKEATCMLLERQIMMTRELAYGDDNPDSVLSQEVVEWIDHHKQHSCDDGHSHLFDSHSWGKSVISPCCVRARSEFDILCEETRVFKRRSPFYSEQGSPTCPAIRKCSDLYPRARHPFFLFFFCGVGMARSPCCQFRCDKSNTCFSKKQYSSSAWYPGSFAARVASIRALCIGTHI